MRRSTSSFFAELDSTAAAAALAAYDAAAAVNWSSNCDAQGNTLCIAIEPRADCPGMFQIYRLI